MKIFQQTSKLFMRALTILALLLSLGFCQSNAKKHNTPACANLESELKKRFSQAAVSIDAKNPHGCKATINYKQSSLQYSEDKKGLLFKNLALYQQVFEQSEMDVQKEKVSFTSAQANQGGPIETIKLTIIPRKNKGRVKTINYFQKNRSVSLGQSSEEEMTDLTQWLLTR